VAPRDTCSRAVAAHGWLRLRCSVVAARVFETAVAAITGPVAIRLSEPRATATLPTGSEAGNVESPVSWLAYHAALVRGAIRAASQHHVTSIAAALAYYAFLTIPSALLVAVGLFGVLAGPDTVDALVVRLSDVMPREATDLISGSLDRVTQEHATGASLIGIGGLLALWSVSGAMQNVMWGLNTIYGREEDRGFVRRRLTAWAMAAFALVGVTLAFVLLVLGAHLSGWIGKALHQETLVMLVWWVGQWPVLVVGLLVAFAGVLFMGPNVEHRRWRFLTYGSVFAVVVWLLASGAFSFYVSQFGSYNKAWGALGAVVVLLTWLWLSALALLLGAEIDAEAERRREPRRRERAETELRAPPKT
jgi:membrane protein